MIEVWRVDIRHVVDDFTGLLSPDEAERAGRFRFEPDRRSFVTTRGILRTLVGARLGIAPEAVAFGYGSAGKPEVEGVSFNASHAGDLALIAVGSGRIGVDVESMRPDVEMLSLARRFFTRSENQALDQLPDEELALGFYGCWTCKEAFVKAVGEGLSFELDRVEVAVHPAPPGIVSVDGDEGAAAAWTLRAVEVGPGHAAAVVVDSPGAEVVVRDWPASAAA